MCFAPVWVGCEGNHRRGLSDKCCRAAAQDKAANAIDVRITTAGNSVASNSAEWYQVEFYCFDATTPHTAAGACKKLGWYERWRLFARPGSWKESGLTHWETDVAERGHKKAPTFWCHCRKRQRLLWHSPKWLLRFVRTSRPRRTDCTTSILSAWSIKDAGRALGSAHNGQKERAGGTIAVQGRRSQSDHQSELYWGTRG